MCLTGPRNQKDLKFMKPRRRVISGNNVFLQEQMRKMRSCSATMPRIGDPEHTKMRHDIMKKWRNLSAKEQQHYHQQAADQTAAAKNLSSTVLADSSGSKTSSERDLDDRMSLVRGDATNKLPPS